MYYFENNLNIDLGLVNALESVLLTIMFITCYKAGDLEHHHLLLWDFFSFHSAIYAIILKHKRNYKTIKSSGKVTTFKIYHQVYCMLNLQQPLKSSHHSKLLANGCSFLQHLNKKQYVHYNRKVMLNLKYLKAGNNIKLQEKTTSNYMASHDPIPF